MIFRYKKLGKFTYHIITDKNQLKQFLLKWIGEEWKIDHEEFPDQSWTTEWINLLTQFEFKIKIVELEKIHLRQDLMTYKSDTYNFQEHLNARADEMEKSLLAGSSLGPLLVKKENMELMDGYTRYTILKKHQQKEIYVYLASLEK